MKILLSTLFLRLPVFSVGIFLALAPCAIAAEKPPYRDTAEYPPFRLSWTTLTDFTHVRGVFPHPVFINRAVVAMDSGIMLTMDAGRTWKKLPEAAVEKVGIVNDVAFHPLEADTFYIASATKGIWVTNDNGGKFRQVGTKAKGMAADSVAGMLVYPGDPTRRTLIAAHGDAAGGLSRSRDNGDTWEVINSDYNFRRVIGGNGNSPQLYLAGSSPKEPDVQNFYACNTAGEYLLEVVRDIVPTDMVCALAPHDPVYITTSDSGVYRVTDGNGGGATHDAAKLVMKGVDGWASVTSAWGPNADTPRIFLYDPTRTGLVMTGDDLATTRAEGDGLLVSPLVKEGAVVRANSNGTVFYAVANGSLFMSRIGAVPTVELTPGIFDVDPSDEDSFPEVGKAFALFMRPINNSSAAAAKETLKQFGDLSAPYKHLQLVITASVSKKEPVPSSVTADLSRFNGSPEAPLYDDGGHGDGAAGDGVYGFGFAFLPKNFHRSGADWRPFWPGRVPVGIVATYPDGHREGAVGIVGIYRRITDFELWDRRGGTAFNAEGEGEVAATPTKNEKGAPHENAAVLEIDAKHGPWSVSVSPAYNAHDITSYAALSFWIKLTAGEAPKELYLQLADRPEFSEPTTTARIPVMEYVRDGGITREYHKVVVPMEKILGVNSPLQTGHLNKIIFSGDAAAPSTLWIDNLKALATMDDPQAPAKGAPAK